ncbi:pseudouridine synthase [Escherichia coli]
MEGLRHCARKRGSLNWFIVDRDTSGVLLVAKKRSALRSLHEQLREKGMQKDYLALVRGQWQSHVKSVQAPLLKIFCKAANVSCVSVRKANRRKHA